MIRHHENPIALKAGALSLLVHGLFFLLLVVSFNWRQVQPLQVAEVELWDSLPAPAVQPPPQPEPKPPEPAPEPKVEPAPEPPPPPPEPKAEIVVKPKPLPEHKPKPEPKPEKKPKEAPKPDPALKAKEEQKRHQEELRKLQQQLLSEDNPLEAQQKDVQQATAERSAVAQAASSGAVNKYKSRIDDKIRRYVNLLLCGSGKPVLEFDISLMPTGEVVGTPRLKKSSGIPACDQAVERAILQAQPLPVPQEPELFAQFRDLSLQFRPNGR